MDAPRFAVDRMLGRLARWLRVLGFDAAYRVELSGGRLLTLAAREERIVLTRDAGLRCPRGRTRVVRIRSDRFRDQLRELDQICPLGGLAERLARCVACNVAIEALAASAVPAQVPEHVRATQQDFRRCPRCRRVYWPASHRAQMEAELAALQLSVPSLRAVGGGGA